MRLLSLGFVGLCGAADNCSTNTGSHAFDANMYIDAFFCGIFRPEGLTRLTLKNCTLYAIYSIPGYYHWFSWYLWDIVKTADSNCSTCFVTFANSVSSMAILGNLNGLCGLDSTHVWNWANYNQIYTSNCLYALYDPIVAVNACMTDWSRIDVVTGLTSTRCTQLELSQFRITYSQWSNMFAQRRSSISVGDYVR